MPKIKKALRRQLAVAAAMMVLADAEDEDDAAVLNITALDLLSQILKSKRERRRKRLYGSMRAGEWRWGNHTWWEYFSRKATDYEFKTTVGMDRATFEELHTLLQPELDGRAMNGRLQFTHEENCERFPRRKSRVLTTRQQLAIFLLRMRDSTRFGQCVTLFNISVGTACNYFYHVLTIYVDVCKDIDIKWPSFDRLCDLASDSAMRAGDAFLGAVASTDGSPFFVFRPCSSYGDQELWYSGAYSAHCMKVSLCPPA
jgi:hypothetical protein